ncbi:hypothetical protein IMZ48_34140 [Candidatus Bathyarchaeota archaeon]|nr:hypothetical protein [Candidatus Bathyarchaeota archaeon]
MQAWEKDGVFEVDPPSIDDIPLASMTAAELREKRPRWHGNIAFPYMVRKPRNSSQLRAAADIRT